MLAQNHDHHLRRAANLEPDKPLRRSPRLAWHPQEWRMACITMFSVHSESRLGLFDYVHHHLHLHRHSLVILAEEIGNRQFSPGRGNGLFHRLGLDYCRVTYHLASPVNLVFRRQATVEHLTRIGNVDGALRVWSKKRRTCSVKNAPFHQLQVTTPKNEIALH